jgi:hypothetical protein
MSSIDDSHQPSLFADDTGHAATPESEPAPRPAASRPVREASAEALPYRLRAYEATPAEIGEANQQQRRKGVNAFKPAQDEIRRISRARTAAMERIEAWMHHPDENVPVELALKKDPKSNSGPWPVLDDYRVQELFAGIVLERADAEGLLWTPLLDAFAGSPYTNRVHTLRYGEGSPRPFREIVAERVESLGRWIALQQDPARVMPLLRFHHPAVQEALARHIRVANDAALTEMLRWSELPPALAANEHLTPEHRRRVEDWAGAELCDSDWPVASEDVSRPALRAYVSHAARRQHAMAQSAVRTLVTLLKSGWQLREGAVQALLETVTPFTPPENPRTAAFHERARPEDRVPHHARPHAFQVLTHEKAALPAEVYESLFERVRHEADRVETLVRHPHVPLALVRRIAREVGAIRVREAMSEIPRLRRDGEVRAELEKSSGVTVLRHLMIDAEGDDRVKLYQRLFRGSESEALAYAVALTSGEERLRTSTARAILDSASTPERLASLERPLRDILDEAQEVRTLTMLLRGAEGERLRTLFARLVAQTAVSAMAEAERHPHYLDALRASDLAPLERWGVRLAAPDQTTSEPDTSEPAEQRRAAAPEERSAFRFAFCWAVRHDVACAVELLCDPASRSLIYELKRRDFAPLHHSADPSACGTSYRRSFRRLVDAGFSALALDFLEDAPADKVAALSALDLAPLLSSSNAEVRTRALSSLRPGMGNSPAPAEYAAVRRAGPSPQHAPVRRR